MGEVFRRLAHDAGQWQDAQTRRDKHPNCGGVEGVTEDDADGDGGEEEEPPRNASPCFRGAWAVGQRGLASSISMIGMPSSTG